MYEKLYRFKCDNTYWIAEYVFNESSLKIIDDKEFSSEDFCGCYLIKENNKWILDKNDDMNFNYFDKTKTRLDKKSIKSLLKYLNTNGDPK